MFLDMGKCLRRYSGLMLASLPAARRDKASSRVAKAGQPPADLALPEIAQIVDVAMDPMDPLTALGHAGNGRRGGESIRSPGRCCAGDPPLDALPQNSPPACERLRSEARSFGAPPSAADIPSPADPPRNIRRASGAPVPQTPLLPEGAWGRSGSGTSTRNAPSGRFTFSGGGNGCDC